MNVLITGSNGLIGSSAVEHFDANGHLVVGIDNNQRAEFFGEAGDTTWNLKRLLESTRSFVHRPIDIRDYGELDRLFGEYDFDLVVHCAAQPSHDRAADIPRVDFEVNALGTLNLLEVTRLRTPEAIFIHMSTNKVYGDAPNQLPLVETNTRWDYADPSLVDGIDETMRVDQSLHSVFGASKLAGDVMAQEYGRYFGLRTTVFRGGCLTGSRHSGVELHGYLSYLLKRAVRGEIYTIYGYGGKQVRDQIHSMDVVRSFQEVIESPGYGEVYNLGGGRPNSASILECIDLIQDRLGRPVQYQYVDRPRRGDHICYISDMSKFRRHYPSWTPEYSLVDMIDEMLESYA